MSAYNPPIENVPIFDSSLFRNTNNSDSALTPAQADSRYLRFPVAQGTENLLGINVSGIADFNSTTNLNSNVYIGGFGSLNLTTANINLSSNATIQQTGSSTSNNFGVSKFNANTTFVAASDIIQESGSQILQQPASTGFFSSSNALNASAVRTNFGSSSSPSLQILDTSSQGIYFLPNAINNAYDNIVQTGDAVIVTTGAPLALANGVSSSTNGIRLDTTQLSLGYGGTGDIPTTLITCDASTINVTPSLTFPDTRVQNSAFTGAGALSGSYTSTNMTIDSNGKITALSNGSVSTGSVSTLVVMPTNSTPVNVAIPTDCIKFDIAVYGSGGLSTPAVYYPPAGGNPAYTIQTGAGGGGGFAKIAGIYQPRQVTQKVNTLSVTMTLGNGNFTLVTYNGTDLAKVYNGTSTTPTFLAGGAGCSTPPVTNSNYGSWFNSNGTQGQSGADRGLATTPLNLQGGQNIGGGALVNSQMGVGQSYAAYSSPIASWSASPIGYGGAVITFYT